MAIDIKPDRHVPHESAVHHGNADERKGNENYCENNVYITRPVMERIQIQVRVAGRQSPRFQNTEPGAKNQNT